MKLNTYSIGLPGSVDLYYAKKAAKYLDTNHYEIVLAEEEFLDAIDGTIYQIESFCTTSVRASVGNYLISLFIKNSGKNRDNKMDDAVVFAGDLSDEIFAFYRGFQKADTAENFFREKNMNIYLLMIENLYIIEKYSKNIIQVERKI